MLVINDKIIEKVKLLMLKLNVEIIQSPYESDHQLTFMKKNGIIDYIITEDTDLIAHGNDNVILKLDKDGDCIQISFSDINLLTYDNFLIFCVLSVKIFLTK